jgi:hypothetical protein
MRATDGHMTTVRTITLLLAASLVLVSCTRHPQPAEPMICQWQSQVVQADTVKSLAADGQAWAFLRGEYNAADTEWFIVTDQGEQPAPSSCNQLFYSEQTLHCAGDTGHLWRREENGWKRVDVPSTFRGPVLVRGERMATITCHRELGIGGPIFAQSAEIVVHERDGCWLEKGAVPFSSCPTRRRGPLSPAPSPRLVLCDQAAYGWGINGTVSIDLLGPGASEVPTPLLPEGESEATLMACTSEDFLWLTVSLRKGSKLGEPLAVQMSGIQGTRDLKHQPDNLLRGVSCSGGSVDKLSTTRLAHARRDDLEIIAISGRPMGQTCASHAKPDHVVQLLGSPHQSDDLVLPGRPWFRGMVVNADGSVQLLVVFDDTAPRRFWQSCVPATTRE